MNLEQRKFILKLYHYLFAVLAVNLVFGMILLSPGLFFVSFGLMANWKIWEAPLLRKLNVNGAITA